jgi:hypothetical protein
MNMEECTMDKNRQYCNCTYEPCSRKLKCCECLHYHRRNGEMPACFFPPEVETEVEKTYDRSIRAFIKINK